MVAAATTDPSCPLGFIFTDADILRSAGAARLLIIIIASAVVLLVMAIIILVATTIIPRYSEWKVQSARGDTRSAKCK